MKEQNNHATLCLSILVSLHLAAFVAVTICQFVEIKDLQDQLDLKTRSPHRHLVQDIADRIKDLFRINDGDTRSYRNKREMVPTVKKLLDEVRKLQNTISTNKCPDDCTSRIFATLGDIAIYSVNPDNNSVRERLVRQVPTPATGTGNELGELFQQIANAELHTFEKYCGNSSKICLPGPKGDQGIRGPAGQDGQQGLKGDVGPPGSTGQKGQTGSEGVAGQQGPQGVKGDNGSVGLQGQTGAKGEQGQKGDTGRLGNRGPTGLKGEMGPRGPSGAQGTHGLMGVPGPKGERGASGPSGPSGLKGDRGLPGKQGAPGVAGQQGLKGNTGAVGQKGDRGVKGESGPQGIQGNRGQKGDRGQKGGASSTCCRNLSKPSFQSKGETITVTEGQQVTLRCAPTSEPPPVVIWSSNVNSIDPSRVTRVNHDIIIRNVTATDKNVYTCQATNVFGTISKIIIVKVLKHISIQSTLQNHTVNEGDPLHLECRFGGNPPPQITWYHIGLDGRRQHVTAGVLLLPDGSKLVIPFAQATDSGSYVCEANNGHEIVKVDALLTVQSRPYISEFTGSGSVTANKGETIRLWCNSTASPTPTVSWHTPAASSNVYEDLDGSLVIVNIAKVEEGRYSCTTTNALGKDKAAITVTVQVPAHATIAPNIIPVRATLFFDCQAEGDSPLTVTWEKDGQPLDMTNRAKYLQLPASGNSHKLLISGAIRQDSGHYACKAANSHGESVSSSIAYEDLGSVTCDSTFALCKTQICGARCPGTCLTSSSPVYGAGTYSSSSSICRAAIQSSILPESSSGRVIWQGVGVQTQFGTSSNHGVTSQSLTTADTGERVLAIDPKNP